MTIFNSRKARLRDLSGDSAYRQYLISRNQPHIVYHSAEIQWKRLRVSARLLRRQIEAVAATIRLAAVAGRRRRTQDHSKRAAVDAAIGCAMTDGRWAS